MKLIIQIPCYNEAQTLEVALNDLPKHIDGIDEIEYLIINDGCQDNTVEVARNWGVHHVVNFKQNQGLAKGFIAGLDGCLRCGADIIVNTDADDQYKGEDIEKLVRPILDGEADIVIGERPIDNTEHFSYVKKKLQHLGSWAVRRASKTDIPDAPSGFRAFSREAAMKLNVVNDYTYTLETIVQAGRENIPMMSVPIRTNPEIRPSRLFKSVWGYVKKSMIIILRAYVMYKPLKAFAILSVPFVAIGVATWIRYIYFVFKGSAQGHIQSLIFGCTCIILGFLIFVIGVLADTVAANRRVLQDVQYHLKRLEYDMVLSGEKEENEPDEEPASDFRKQRDKKLEKVNSEAM